MIKNNNRNSRDDKSNTGNRSTTGKSRSGTDSTYKGKSKFGEKDEKDAPRGYQGKSTGPRDFKPREEGASRGYQGKSTGSRDSNQEKKALQEVTRAKAQDRETSNLEKKALPEVTRVKAVKPGTSNQEHQELVMAKLLKQEVTSKKTTLLQVQKNHSESLMIKKVEALEVQTADLLEKEKKMATDRRLMLVVTKTPLSGVENQHHQKRMMA